MKHHLTRFAVAAAAASVLAGVGASGALAATDTGTLTGHILATADVSPFGTQTLSDCNFEVDYSGGQPPSTLTLDGGTFRGDGTASGCDTSGSMVTVSSPTITFPNGSASPFTADLSTTTVSGTVPLINDTCTFTTTTPQPSVTSPTSLTGPYMGTFTNLLIGGASVCEDLSDPMITISNAEFGPLLSDS